MDRMLSESYEPLLWATDIHETPTKNRTTYPFDTAEDPVIEATPVQILPTEQAYSAPLDDRQADVPSSHSKEPLRSIYASLGWDDQVDELA